MKTMKWILLLLVVVTLASCEEEDPGPRQNDSRSYSIVDFDRLEMGDAFVVTVQQGPIFSVTAEGDRRNLDDLTIDKSGSSLIAKYNTYRNRQYLTYITITMPTLSSVNFSSAVNAKVYDFTSGRIDVVLSGASLAQMNVDATEVFCNISGASQLRLTGEGQKIDGVISGASFLNTFDFPVLTAKLNVSGASTGRVTVSDLLNGDVSGASTVIYRGAPQLNVQVTGASVVRRD